MEISRQASGLHASSSFRCLQAYQRPIHRRHTGRLSRHTCCAEGHDLKLFSPSKINLFLRIVGKREDGYHDLASLFHVINVGDNMRFRRRRSGAHKDLLSCKMEHVPTDRSNLVIKALDLFREKTGESIHLDVHLDKQVPMGAGLGGGSANAATTLWAVNELTGRPAKESDLQDWAGEIGSDISVFFSHGAAYCTGRGEIVEDVEPPLPLDTPLLLVKPPTGCSTPQIFKLLQLDNCSKTDPKELLSQLTLDSSCLSELCINDLEQPAFQMLEELKSLKQRLEQDSDRAFSTVFMTGSGSTLVCIGSDQKPEWLGDAQYKKTFVRPARLLCRSAGQWYQRGTLAAAL